MSVVNRVCPTLQELLLTGGRKCTTKFKSKNIEKEAFQFYCPIQGCVHDNESHRYFNSLASLRQHARKVHLPKIYDCEKCKKGFAVLSDLVRHSHVCGTDFKCSSCDARYSTREALLTHAKRKQHVILNDTFRKRSITCNKVETTNISTLYTLPKVIHSGAFVAISNVSNSTKLERYRLILPKATVFIPTFISDRYERKNVKCVESGTQTESSKKRNANCSKAKNKTGTIPTRTNFRVKKKTVRRHTSCQTELLKEKRTVETTTTQTDFISAIQESLQAVPENVFISEYSTRCGNNQMWSGTQSNTHSNLNKCIQTLDELDVETRFPMSPAVTTSTQTSPRGTKMNPNYLSADRMLDSPINRYFGIDLGNLHEFNQVFANKYSSLVNNDGSVRVLSSETQTDSFNCLNLDAEQSNSDIDMEETLCYDIHTQTPRDLDSIPYDQLLTNMETQTSDPFLLSALALCDIETQTAVGQTNESVGLVDTHTQTSCYPIWRTDANVNDMETQTFIPTLESELMDSHTQTPESWKSLLNIFNEY